MKRTVTAMLTLSFVLATVGTLSAQGSGPLYDVWYIDKNTNEKAWAGPEKLSADQALKRYDELAHDRDSGTVRGIGEIWITDADGRRVDPDDIRRAAQQPTPSPRRTETPIVKQPSVDSKPSKIPDGYNDPRRKGSPAEKKTAFVGTWVARHNGVAFMRFKADGTGESGSLAFNDFAEMVNSTFTWSLEGNKVKYRYSDGSGSSTTLVELQQDYEKQ